MSTWTPQHLLAILQTSKSDYTLDHILGLVWARMKLSTDYLIAVVLTCHSVKQRIDINFSVSSLLGNNPLDYARSSDVGSPNEFDAFNIASRGDAFDSEDSSGGKETRQEGANFEKLSMDICCVISPNQVIASNDYHKEPQTNSVNFCLMFFFLHLSTCVPSWIFSARAKGDTQQN
jgi:hypothetical protein